VENEIKRISKMRLFILNGIVTLIIPSILVFFIAHGSNILDQYKLNYKFALLDLSITISSIVLFLFIVDKSTKFKNAVEKRVKAPILSIDQDLCREIILEIGVVALLFLILPRDLFHILNSRLPIDYNYLPFFLLAAYYLSKLILKILYSLFIYLFSLKTNKFKIYNKFIEFFKLKDIISKIYDEAFNKVNVTSYFILVCFSAFILQPIIADLAFKNDPFSADNNWSVQYKHVISSVNLTKFKNDGDQDEITYNGKAYDASDRNCTLSFSMDSTHSQRIVIHNIDLISCKKNKWYSAGNLLDRLHHPYFNKREVAESLMKSTPFAAMFSKSICNEVDKRTETPLHFTIAIDGQQETHECRTE
jgi:hypothetical protein